MPPRMNIHHELLNLNIKVVGKEAILQHSEVAEEDVQERHTLDGV